MGLCVWALKIALAYFKSFKLKVFTVWLIIKINYNVISDQRDWNCYYKEYYNNRIVIIWEKPPLSTY